MSITSFNFYLLLTVAILIYYLFPLKIRWIGLFVINTLFLFSLNGYYEAFVAIIIVIWTYLGTLLISKYRDHLRISKTFLILLILGLISTLFFYKEQYLIVGTANNILKLFEITGSLSVFSTIAPLGISYFVLVLISYACEVYWGTIQVQKNPIRFLTFSLFFPILTSGPILKYKDTYPELFNTRRFDYSNFCFGLQRILWGLFKKLVISERLSIFVTSIYEKESIFQGIYIPLAAMAFTIQLYTDFSGCIDIIMGVSQLFGINLPENFNYPFSAKTISEFWRRWHITLGDWLKAYIFYPILKSSLFQKMIVRCQEVLGKKIGKKIPTWIALLLSWIIIGLWHGGGYNYIFGVGLYMGSIIVLSEMLDPLFIKIKKLLRINDQVFSWKLFQIIRTFLLFSFGLSFFRAPSLSEGFKLWKRAFSVWNPWILFAEPIEQLGLSPQDYRILQYSILVMLLAGIVSYQKKESIRELISKQNIVFRWLIYLVLYFVVVIYGKYGPGYVASEFIYKGF